MTKRVVLTGGGTGGHVYPALAIAEAIDGLAEVVYVGDPKRLEGRVVPERGYQFAGLPTPMTPGSPLGLPLFAGRLLVAVARSIRLLRSLRPDLVIGVGGFVSVPAMIAAIIMRRPAAIHEQNVRPGKANRLMTRLGVHVMATFDGTAKFVPEDRFVLTGCPVRPEFGATPKPEAREKLGLPPEAQVCLIVGGSNGAAALNEAAFAIVGRLDANPNLHAVHITGRRYYDDVAARRDATVSPHLHPRFWIAPYADEIATYFAAADIVISRSGSSTVNELLCAGRASVLIPSPNVTEDHQTANARYIESRGAAVVIPESDLGTVTDHVLALLHDPGALDRLSLAAASSCTGSAARDQIRSYIASRLGLETPTTTERLARSRSGTRSPAHLKRPR